MFYSFERTCPSFFYSLCLSLSLLVVDLTGFCNGAFVTEDNINDCQVYGTTLQCDFNFITEDVRVDGSANKFKTILVKNVHQLLLHDGLCSSVNLYHISSVIYINSSSNQEQTDDCDSRSLHLNNVTIDQIPPYLTTFSMENSRLVGSFMHQPWLKKIKVVGSYIHKLYLDDPVGEEGEVRLHNTNISSLAKLVMAKNSKFFLTDSVVEEFDLSAIILRENSSAEIMRTKFLQRKEATIFHQEDARIIMANITGLFSVVYIKGHGNGNGNSDVKQAMEEGTPAGLIILAILLAISMSLNLMWLIRTLMKRKSNKGTKKRKPKTGEDNEDDVIRQTKFKQVIDGSSKPLVNDNPA